MFNMYGPGAGMGMQSGQMPMNKGGPRPTMQEQEQQKWRQGWLDRINAEYQWQNDRNEVNQENRYGDIGQGMYDLWQRQNADVQAYGQQQKEDSLLRSSQQMGNANQQMRARGLMGGMAGRGSTQPAQWLVHQGIPAQEAEMRRIDADILNRRLEVDRTGANNMYGFMERRTDTPPDYSQISNMYSLIMGDQNGNWTDPGRRNPWNRKMPKFPGAMA